jgi:8-oxo-dGTP pyrophosphatase MutT (NUDIX family)
MRRGKRQVSSGGLVYRGRGGGIEVALILRRVSSGHSVYSLPKGWVEPGESLEAAALREVREETGITARIIDKLGDIRYQFYAKEEGAYVHKTVHFYLMEYLQGDVTDHDREVEEAAWFPLEEAEAKMPYATERAILKKGRERLTAGQVGVKGNKKSHG